MSDEPDFIPDSPKDIAEAIRFGQPEAEERATIQLWVTPTEGAILDALRADPDQERHIVHFGLTFDGEGLEVVVRHPISERLLADALFSCPALAFTEDFLEANEMPPGRYRMSTEGDDLVRMEL